MRIDCIAERFIRAGTEEEIREAIQFARENDLPFLVIGNGSNLIFPSFYGGLIILIDLKDFHVEEKEEGIELIAGAGIPLPKAAREITERKGEGMEWAGGVPGTMGGAVRGNAGAFGDLISDHLLEVEALDMNELKKRTFTKEECAFDYRDSFFKRNGGYIILSVRMLFPRKKNEDSKFEEFLKHRKENHPQDPSAGSVFKNPEVDDEFYNEYTDMERFRELGFIPARVLVEECGLKGKKRGGAMISYKHPNFIVNKGGATGKNVKELISLVKERVREKFGIEMEEEVVIVE